MSPLIARNSRRSGRNRAGLALAPIEALERREVLSYSPLGYSLPDLTLRGFSGPVAAYGGNVGVTLNVYNRGASSMVEPLNLYQSAPSTADAPATTVQVFASTQINGGGKSVLLGSISVPAIRQNDVAVVTDTVPLPTTRPAGFPGNGGRIFLTYVINPDQTFLETDYTNNVATSANVVRVQRGLPDLQVIGFNTPSPLQPGDVLQPSVEIANIGTADTSAQGPVVVQIVASQDTKYGAGDTILATYTVDNIPALATVPSYLPVIGDANLVPGANVVTLSSLAVALPTSPSTYFLGVKVDPLHTLKQLGIHSGARFDAFVKVGPPIAGLPPTNYLTTTTVGTTVTPTQFPFPLTTSTTASSTSNLTSSASGTFGVAAANSAASTETGVTTAAAVANASAKGAVGSIGARQLAALQGVFRSRGAVRKTVAGNPADSGSSTPALTIYDATPQVGAQVPSRTLRVNSRLSASFVRS